MAFCSSQPGRHICLFENRRKHLKHHKCVFTVLHNSGITLTLRNCLLFAEDVSYLVHLSVHADFIQKNQQLNLSDDFKTQYCRRKRDRFLDFVSLSDYSPTTSRFWPYRSARCFIGTNQNPSVLKRQKRKPVKCWEDLLTNLPSQQYRGRQAITPSTQKNAVS